MGRVRADQEETMSRTFTTGLVAATSLLLAGSGASAASTPAPIAAAVADSGRPAADVARDPARKPAEMLTFAGLKPGDVVLELLPGGGYFTRIISKAVGPTGHLYAAAPDPKSGDAEPAASAIAADPKYPNVSVIGISAAAIAALPPLDVVWTSQNYHDMHLTRVHADVPAFDKLVFSKLKPGGVFIVIDHAALPGAPVTETADKLHRIDPAAVRQEVEGAGFKFDGATDVLRNPADPHTALVFDPSIRGKTDQFVFKFSKPG
jgi:predicted methyltransferase